MKACTTLLLTATLAVATLAAYAQTPEQTNRQAVLPAAAGGESPAQDRIVNRFAGFAGSEDNARSLVTGLRQGGEITLTAPDSGGQAGTGITFTPPTRPMGYGNVGISLALAREQLAQLGIAQPTPEQLQAALVGGTVTAGSGSTATTTELKGVLQMRAEGMGWGRIANAMGGKLGHVVSGRTGQQAASAPSAPTTGSASAGAGTGVTTAAGAASATAQARVRGNSAAAHEFNRPASGITTAAGDAVTGMGAGTRVQGAAGGAGAVTGAGAAARASAGGQGKGYARY